ncbi:MAG: ribosome maturation factor RimM [Pseudomonadota bacterium]
MTGRLLCVGVITGAHGIRGEVRIKTFTEEPGAVASYGPLRNKPGDRSFEITRHRIQKGQVIAALEGIRDRNAAEALKGTELYLDRQALPDLDDEEEFYHADLIGLEARLADGSVFGRVAALQDFGAGDVVEIAPAGGGSTLLLPFTREVVPEVRLAEGHIVVSPPEEIE